MPLTIGPVHASIHNYLLLCRAFSIWFDAIHCLAFALRFCRRGIVEVFRKVFASMSSHFLFMVCQVGAETALKQEVARRHPDFRFSFSRRGFVTFRIPDEVARDRKFELKCAFARTWGFSLGKATGTDGHQLARDFWQPFVERYPAEVLAQFRHLHVWQRDRDFPGDSDFEPGITPLAEAIGDLILEHQPNAGIGHNPDRKSTRLNSSHRH